MIKECEDCGECFDSYKSNRKLRCKVCQEKYRSNYKQSHNKRYRVDKPKSATTGKYYQYWKFAETLTDEELITLYQVRKQKLSYVTDWKEKQEIKTQMKILNDIYNERVGDRVLENKRKEHD